MGKGKPKSAVQREACGGGKAIGRTCARDRLAGTRGAALALAEVGTDWEAGMRVIATELPFKDHFHRFALRNLNSQFFPDNPLGKRYVDLDPGFPDEYMPQPEVVEQLTGQASDAPVLAYPVNLPALKAHYYHVSMAESVQQVRFDFSAVGPQTDHKVSALVKLKGQPWELREKRPDVLTFCIEEEPQLQHKRVGRNSQHPSAANLGHQRDAQPAYSGRDRISGQPDRPIVGG